MNSTAIEQVQQLHTAWQDATGLSVPLRPMVDVKLVVKYRMRLNKERGISWSLHINRLLGDEENELTFFTHLAEARAVMRKPVFSQGKAEALRSTGRADEPLRLCGLSTGPVRLHSNCSDRNRTG